MKLRTGFVSNSSSTSFLIYGAEITREDRDKFEASHTNTNLDTFYGPESGNRFIGKSWSSIKDEETGKQFKDSIKEEIKTILGHEVDCYTFEEAGRD